MTRATALLLVACASGTDDLTRGQAYDAVRPASCDRIARCAPAQYAREYASREECLAKGRPRFPMSADLSTCTRTQADKCVAAQNERPCDVAHVDECDGC